MARRANCCVANAFSTRLKQIWQKSSLKTTKMSKKTHFWQKAPGANGLNINTTRLKERLLATIPDLTAQGKQMWSLMILLGMPFERLAYRTMILKHYIWIERPRSYEGICLVRNSLSKEHSRSIVRRNRYPHQCLPLSV